jgi:hypothetical protein
MLQSVLLVYGQCGCVGIGVRSTGHLWVSQVACCRVRTGVLLPLKYGSEFVGHHGDGVTLALPVCSNLSSMRTAKHCVAVWGFAPPHSVWLCVWIAVLSTGHLWVLEGLCFGSQRGCAAGYVLAWPCLKSSQVRQRTKYV